MLPLSQGFSWRCRPSPCCTSVKACSSFLTEVVTRRAQVDEATDLRNLDEARVRSLADREAAAAAQKPLAQWADADLLERFADSRVLPLVRSPGHRSHMWLDTGARRNPT